MPGRDVFIVECTRTPIGVGRRTGSLNSIHPVDLLAQQLNTLMEKAGVDKSQVEDVITGCVTPVGKQGANIGRLAVLKAGFPVTVPSVQLNRMCGSGQQAIHFASQAIAAGDMDMVIACGVEMMGVVKMGSDSTLLSKPDPKFAKEFPYKLLHQGQSADMIGARWGITRTECDAFAGASHEKAAAATKAGHFRSQIDPVKITQADGSVKVLAHDEGIKVPVAWDKVRKLRTIFSKNGVVTAANASQISDGASAILLCSGEKADQLRLTKRARVVGRVAVGSDPELMLTAPIPATQLVLSKTGLTIKDMDVIEINEAFATVVLAWAKEIQPDMRKVNPNGGAIAHGHPLGATGCVLMTKLVNELERTGGRYGLQTMCIGHGQGTATIIERVGGPRASL